MTAYKQVKTTENLMRTSLENNITATLIGRTNTETLTRTTSLENNITATLTGRKCSRKPKVDEYDGLASSQTSILKKSLQNSSTESSCRSLRHVFTARY